MADYTPTGVPVTRSRPASAEIRNEFGLIAAAIATKQDALTLKTVAGQSIVGSGNVALTKSDVGLANVDNTSDANKPVSTATAAALAGKANSTHTHIIGDVTGLQAALDAKQATLVSASNIKTINGVSVLGAGDISITPGGGGVTSVNTRTGAVTLTSADVGLGNVNNTSDLSKPISTATQAALDAKQATLVSASNIRTVAGQSILGSGNVALAKADVGLANVDNTADTAKPVSTAQQTALNGKLSIDGTIAMTAPLRAAAGTRTAPSYTFDGSTSSGFYSFTGSVAAAGSFYVVSSTANVALLPTAMATSNTDFTLTVGGFQRQMVRADGTVSFGSMVSNPIADRVNAFVINPAATGGVSVRQPAGATNWAVAASTGAVFNFYSDNGSAGVFAGSVTVNGNTASFNSASDSRLKKDVAWAPSALARVADIKVRSFNWIDDNKHVEYGFVAQELREVAPDAVTTPEDPETMLAVDHSKLVPMLVKAVQELKQKVEELEKTK